VIRPAYHINVILDEAPVISVEEKQDSVSMKSLYFNGKIQDDHGFSDLNFHYSVQPAGNKGNSKTFVKRVDADMKQTAGRFLLLLEFERSGHQSLATRLPIFLK
jgi:hypothetical protein